MQSCGKLEGPSSKAKYYRLTDSELVPRGKGEKNPDEGSEIVPEIVCLQAVRGLWLFGAMSNYVPFAWAGELLVCSKVKPIRWSRSESESEMGDLVAGGRPEAK